MRIYHATITYKAAEVKLHIFFTSELDELSRQVYDVAVLYPTDNE